MRKTLNAINLSMPDLERAVSRELQSARGGTVIVRNVNSATSAEKVARSAMGDGWDVNCTKKGSYFLLTLYKGIMDKKNARALAT